MGSAIKILYTYMIIAILSALLEFYFKGLSYFFDRSFVESLGLLYMIISINFLCMFFLYNLISSLLFYVCGRIYGLQCSTIKLYPFYLCAGNLKVHWSLSIMFLLENSYSIENHKESKVFINKRRKAEYVQKILFFILCVFAMLASIFTRNSIYIYFIGVVFIKHLHKQVFYPSQDQEHCFKELLFSKHIEKSILINHVDYVEREIDHIVGNPDEFRKVHFLVFACYHRKDEDATSSLCRIDKQISDILFQYGENLSIASRDAIFQYYDNRICLSLITKGELYDLRSYLNAYISMEWDGVALPKAYIKRYAKLKEWMDGRTDEITFQHGYGILYD